MPSKTPYNPVDMLAGVTLPSGEWVSGFFDQGSFTETLMKSLYVHWHCGNQVLGRMKAKDVMPKPLTALPKTLARSRLVTEPSFAPTIHPFHSFRPFLLFLESPFQVSFVTAFNCSLDWQRHPGCGGKEANNRSNPVWFSVRS